ncbi:MAG TPA: DUF2179 domain-containing protein [Anaerolineaceae bacterium]|jgi:uncharacterized protein YebE (UPF0316 family)|nr:DUF2179 domain-containing protein [Anaerolineaceae bacterium]
MASFLGISDADFYSWVVLPIIIFFARISDVTIGTVRIIFVARGKRRVAPLLGFFEVLIWIVVIGQLVQHLQSATSYIGYAAGFAAGNYIGMLVEERLAIGTLIVRTILDSGGDEVMQLLHDAGYGVTIVDGQGATGPVKLVYTVVKRKHLKDVIRIIHSVHPKAFVSIEDLRASEEGIFPSQVDALRKS